MQQNQEQQPVIFLKEGSERTEGREAQNGNIAAAKAVAQAIRTTLGPEGMDKMLVDAMGDVVITNDGSTILREMEIEHPAARMMVEIATTQDEMVGDGTTTAVVIAGELLRQAEELLEQDIHPTVIAHGYRKAAQKAGEILGDIAINVHRDDAFILRRVAETAMTGKGAEAAREKLATLVVDAVSMVADDDGYLDQDYLKIEQKVGGSIEESELVEGIVIDKERLHPGMPARVEDARILLLNAPIEFSKGEVDTEITITSPDEVQQYLDEEERMVRVSVEKILASGANVVFCQKGIDETAEMFLSRAGVIALRRVKRSDMERLSRATGASVVNRLESVLPSDLGYAATVEERKTAGQQMIYVTGCDNPKVATLLVRGGTKQVVDEVSRAIDDALQVVGLSMEDGQVLPGGGAPEMELSLRLREFATGESGRVQLAIESFSKALEIVPRSIAENSGLDPIDAVINLRIAHEQSRLRHGINVEGNAPVDMLDAGVLEPIRVKSQAISSAVEAAIMVIRVDDIISAAPKGPGDLSPEEMGGMAPGMGGMPGGMGGLPPGLM
ncbi:MAG: thermosome subunit alpha [Methanomicrobiaceae archaeon]|nr:thermosome subunit alpha [Methanomicrobiaceae archaeon]